jgi:molybdopterin converting factor small subunit
MTVRVEFYGVPRYRAGVASVEVEADRLGEALAAVGRRLPDLQDVCIDEHKLRSGFLANLNGRTFVSDPATRLAPGDCVLILSSDVGG